MSEQQSGLVATVKSWYEGFGKAINNMRENLTATAVLDVKAFVGDNIDDLEEQIGLWVRETGNLVYGVSAPGKLDEQFTISVVYLQAFDESYTAGIAASAPASTKKCCRVGDDSGECTNACAAAESGDEGLSEPPRAERCSSRCGGP